MDIFRPVRYLYYRVWSIHSEESSLRATGMVLALISLNEMSIFGDRWLNWVKSLCGDDSSKLNWKLWAFYGVQMALVWLFLGRNTDRIANEFKHESVANRKLHGLFVWIYVALSVVSFFYRVFFT